MEENNETKQPDTVTEEKQNFTREEVQQIIDSANYTIKQLNDTNNYKMFIDKIGFLFKIVENAMFFGDEAVNKAVDIIKNSIIGEEKHNEGSDLDIDKNTEE